MGKTMIRKGYGRIYVADENNIKGVINCIKQIDAQEYEGYYVKGLVTPYTGKVELIYTHKFEIDMDKLTEMCWKEGIWIWIISQQNEYWGQ